MVKWVKAETPPTSEGVKYLVWNDHPHRPWASVCVAYYDGPGRWNEASGGILQHVTHWARLPARPAEVEQDAAQQERTMPRRA